MFSEARPEGFFPDALRLWRQVLFLVRATDEFFDYLADFGCTVDGDLVRFPQPVMDKVLARLARQKRARA